MPKGNQKVEDAINRMHYSANDLIHHARNSRSKSLEWEGLMWQKDLLEHARNYVKSMDRLTRIRSAARRKPLGLRNKHD